MRLKSGAESLFIELDFNGAGVLADSCVCACCHGFQLSSGAVQREELSRGWGAAHFHPASDLFLWTNGRFHMSISIHDWLHCGSYTHYFQNVFSFLRGCRSQMRQITLDVTSSIAMSGNDSVFLWGLFWFASIWVRGALADVYVGATIQRRGYEVISSPP